MLLSSSSEKKLVKPLKTVKIVFFGPILLHRNGVIIMSHAPKMENFFFGRNNDTIALSYPPRVRVRAMVKLSVAFFHDESSITIGGIQKCNSTKITKAGHQLSESYFIKISYVLTELLIFFYLQ